jgi:hypothetical protein
LKDEGLSTLAKGGQEEVKGLSRNMKIKEIEVDEDPWDLVLSPVPCHPWQIEMMYSMTGWGLRENCFRG